jgi:hypothetical protein
MQRDGDDVRMAFNGKSEVLFYARLGGVFTLEEVHEELQDGRRMKPEVLCPASNLDRMPKSSLKSARCLYVHHAVIPLMKVKPPP